MREVEATVTLVDQWRPVELYHVARGLRWNVPVVGQLRVYLELAKGGTDPSLGTVPPLEDAVPG